MQQEAQKEKNNSCDNHGCLHQMSASPAERWPIDTQRTRNQSSNSASDCLDIARDLP